MCLSLVLVLIVVHGFTTGVVVLAVQSRILSALFIKLDVELFRFSGMLYMYQFPTDIQVFNFNPSCVFHCLEINALLIVP